MKKILLIATLSYSLAAQAMIHCLFTESSLEINSKTATKNIDDALAAATSREERTFTLRNEINRQSINRLIQQIQNFIEADGAIYRTINISLDSTGGDITQARRLHTFLQSIRENPQVTVNTRVSAGNSCESACTIIFTAGENRYASERTRFGFHSPDYQSGRRRGESVRELEERTRQQWLGYIEAIDPAAANRIREERLLYGSNMRYISARDLTTGYVTEIL